MKIVVIGGGKVGYYLVKTVMEKHDVVLIESDINTCENISNELGIPVIHGDGSELSVLMDAGVSEADVLVALTGRDQDNLVACQVLNNNFSNIRTIARVNNPKNKKVFEDLNIADVVISSTSTISNLIENEVTTEDLVTLLTFRQGNMAIVELEIPSSSTVVDKKVLEIAPDLPDNTVLVSIIREGEVIFPKGETFIKSGDSILAVTTIGQEKLLANVLKGD